MVHPPYTVSQIRDIIRARADGRRETQKSISYLLTDSRQIRFADHSLFFALVGPHHDGHNFLEEVYEKGVRCFVVARIPPNRPGTDAVFLLVPDTLKALQALCRFHRSQFEIPVMGITGSNGKTIVKEWLFQLLQENFYIVRSPRSYNSQIGVPLSVWAMRSAHQLGIFEAGISLPSEMDQLEAIIQPTIGLFTNLGSAHDAGFTGRDQKLREKLKLFRNVDVIIYRSGEEVIDRAIATLGRKTFSWSFQRGADLQIQEIAPQGHFTTVRAIHQNIPYTVRIPFIDSASVENAIHCWAAGLFLGLDPPVLASRLEQLTPIAMRLELQEGRHGCTLINDSYNSDLQSLAIALEFAQQQRTDSKLVLVLSDILQMGIPSDQLYREVARLIDQHRVNRVIGVGEAIPQIASFLPPNLEQHFFAKTQDLLYALEQLSFREETILIKGARPFGFEAIARRLLPHAHRTLLEINLSAIAHNVRAFNALLGPGTEMMAMVKAAAYGSGSAEVARLLAFQGIQYLGVAYVDEGVELRKAGIRVPIMVLNPEPLTFSSLLEYDLEPEVYSLSQLEALCRFIRSRATSMGIHLKLESGMRRLGFMASEVDDLVRLLQDNSQLSVASIFSHLAASETSLEDEFTRHQAATFNDLYEKIVGHLHYRPRRHLLNTAGIARFPQYQMEMVRLGIGMYGVEICMELRGLLRPVFRLRSRISQIRVVPGGESIGYGRKGRSEARRRIATVSIGYADGLLRKAGNGSYHFRLHDSLAPTVGNVCMDMCMIDVTHIPGAREGDEVLIFGEELPIEELAKIYETIPYEVLTGISARVKRVYIME